MMRSKYETLTARKQHILDNRSWILDTFKYEDGKLFRRSSNKRAGTSTKTYRFIGVNGKQCLEHLVVWIYFNNWMPEAIDHINQDKQDNRIHNLRASTKQRNEVNTGPRKNNFTGFKGVRKHTTNNSFTVQLNVGKAQVYISSETSPEDAALVYNFHAYEWYGTYCQLNEVEQPWLDAVK